MRRFAEIVLKFRLIIILAVFLITIFFGYGLTKVKINSDMLSYLKPDDPIIKLFNQIGDDYGGNTLVLVAIENKDIFSVKSLELIRDLSEQYSQINDVSGVTSLTNVLDIKKTEDGLEISKLINKNNMPTTKEELSDLREYTMNKDMYSGKMISKDGKISLIICRLKADAVKEVVAGKIKKITEKIKNGNTVYYSGLPMQMLDVNELIIEDLGGLIPIVILMVIIVLYLSFRSKRGVVLPLLTVVFSTVWSIGLMGWLGVEMSIISNIMPILLIAIGTAYGIHFLSKYNEVVKLGDDRIVGIQTALSEVGVPILLSGVTTLIGFLSFAGSTLTAVTDFGLFTAFGVGVAMILSITFVPASLSYMIVKERRKKRRIHLSKITKIKGVANLGDFVLNNEKQILIITIIIVLISIFAIPKIKTEVNMTEYFAEDSSIRISDDIMRTKFGGSLPIQILIKGDIKNPFILKEMLKFENYLESLKDVNSTQSIADLVCEMNDVMNGHYTIPETNSQVANLLFMLEGEDILDQLVNKDYTEGVIQARFANQNTKKILSTVKAIDKYINTMINTDLLITYFSKLDPTQQQLVQQKQIENISKTVLYDANKRKPNVIVNIDNTEIEKNVKKNMNKTFFPLNEKYLNSLDDKLLTFFTEEADIEIDSEYVIANTIKKIKIEAKNKKLSEDELNSLLLKTIPEKIINNDFESVKSTAFYLKTMLDELNANIRIEILTENLIKLFPQSLQEDIKFYNDLKADLWILNEEIISIPINLDIDPSEKTLTEMSVQQSGMLIVMKQINESLLNSQFQSLFLSLFMVLIIMMIQFKSIKMGAIITSPIILTVLVNFAIMGYSGVPLDNATMMIASIAIGIGIDYSIHFSSRLKLELKNSNFNELQSLQTTLGTTGRAILINATTVGLGFVILVGSNIVPMQRFGWLIAITMLVSSTAALTFLPSMILYFKKGLFKNNIKN